MLNISTAYQTSRLVFSKLYTLLKSASTKFYCDIFRLFFVFFAIFLGKLSLFFSAFLFRKIINEVSATHLIFAFPALTILAYGLIYLGAFIFQEIREILSLPIIEKIKRQFSLELNHSLFHAPLLYHQHRETGKLLQKIERGQKAIELIFSDWILKVLPCFFEVTAIAILITLHFSPLFAILLLSASLFYAGFSKKIESRLAQYRNQIQETEEKWRQKTLENFTHIETVQLFNQQESTKIALERIQQKSEKEKQLLRRWQAFANLGRNSILWLSLILLLLLTTYRIVQHQASVGDLLLILTLSMQIYQPIMLVGNSYHEAKTAVHDFAESLSLLDLPTEEKKANRSAILNNGEIFIKNISFAYPQQKPIFENFTLHIPARSTLAVIGKSGKGKSTLAKLLLGFYKPTQGEISIDGFNLHQLDPYQLRKSVALLSQELLLFDESIRFNIAYGNPEASDLQIETAAKAAHIHDFIQALPLAYQTRVGERGTLLSGGQKQRIALARVLLRKPTVLILDEPNSALDGENTALLQKTLRTLQKTTTLILITHTPYLAKMADFSISLT